MIYLSMRYEHSSHPSVFFDQSFAPIARTVLLLITLHENQPRLQLNNAKAKQSLQDVHFGYNGEDHGH